MCNYFAENDVQHIRKTLNVHLMYIEIPGGKHYV